MVEDLKKKPKKTLLFASLFALTLIYTFFQEIMRVVNSAFFLLSQKTKLLIYFCGPKLKLYEEHKIFLGVSFILPCFTALLSILRKAVFLPLLFSMFLFNCHL